jgi:2-methylfumaryl-CoA hydratase
LSFNGLANALNVAAINGGRHTNPAFAGDTIYAWSEVLEKLPLPQRRDVGALRIRTVAVKDRPCRDFPDRDAQGAYNPSVVLDFDYVVLMPRREIDEPSAAAAKLASLGQ